MLYNIVHYLVTIRIFLKARNVLSTRKKGGWILGNNGFARAECAFVTLTASILFLQVPTKRSACLMLKLIFTYWFFECGIA